MGGESRFFIFPNGGSFPQHSFKHRVASGEAGQGATCPGFALSSSHQMRPGAGNARVGQLTRQQLVVLMRERHNHPRPLAALGAVNRHGVEAVRLASQELALICLGA